jgi:transposase
LPVHALFPEKLELDKVLTMSKVIMIGCDVHDAKLVMKLACGAEPQTVLKSWAAADVPGLIEWLGQFAAEHGAERIVLAYEASGAGFELHDRLKAAGIECYVLAPTHLPHTARARKTKTDANDAQMLLDEVRAHVLAGRKLPRVWVPNEQTRNDRELVRQRLGMGEQRTRIKNQIRNMLKRQKNPRCRFPAWFTKTGNWSRRSLRWLRDLAVAKESSGESGEVRWEGLDAGVRTALGSLLALYDAMSEQLKVLDRAIVELSKTERYKQAFGRLKLQPGVGTLTAMTFLTELGDLNRFANRRQLGSYLGLVPTSFESGQRDDRKGHITHQGPARLRHVLCQAAWAALRCSAGWRERYDRIKGGSAKRSKIAIVAIMRQLAVSLWHAARSSDLDEHLALRAELAQLKTLRRKARENKSTTATSAKARAARARQKGTAPTTVAITSTWGG